VSSPEVIKAELESLSDFRYKLMQFSEKIDTALEKASQACRQEIERLQELCDQRRQELEDCISAYEACRSCTDDDGRPPPCSAEAAAVREAQQALMAAERCLSSFSSQSEQLMSGIKTTANSASESIDGARDDLERYIKGVLEYLRGNDIAVPLRPGEEAHGSGYRTARSRYFREGAQGDYENIPDHLRGHMRGEVDHGGYYHSPGDYDVGHYVRHINIPENFNFERRFLNRRHGAIGAHYHLNNF
jgi:hypothetical protein